MSQDSSNVPDAAIRMQLEAEKPCFMCLAESADVFQEASPEAQVHLRGLFTMLLGNGASMGIMVLLDRDRALLPPDSPPPTLKEINDVFAEHVPLIAEWLKRSSCDMHAALMSPPPGTVQSFDFKVEEDENGGRISGSIKTETLM